MAFQTGRPVKVPARGDAASTGAPGPTPPPTAGQLALQKDTSYGRQSYGANAYGGRVVADPGKTVTSPLADQLRSKAAEGDGGDLLGDIIQHGSARNVSAGETMAPQTRDVPDDLRNVHPAMKRQTTQSPKPGDVVVGELPKTCGASAAPSPVDPYAK